MKSASLILACWSGAFCAAFSGCGDNELAEVNFIRSDPPTDSIVPTVLARVELFFDGTPRSVTVEGVPAHVERTIATWEIPDELDRGDVTLDVAWLNQDGSEGKGTVIHYRTALVSFEPIFVVESTLDPTGHKDVDPDQINRSGITFRFNQDVRPGTIEIRPEGGKSLNWSVTWESDSVTIIPQSDEDKLLSGKNYVIKFAAIEADRPDIREGLRETFNVQTMFSTKE